MPFKFDAGLKAKLAELEAAMKAAKQEAQQIARARSPLATRVRRLKASLERAEKSRTKMRSWHGWDDRTNEQIHGQQWRDNTARIASLTAELLSAQTTLELFDLEHT